MDNVRSPEEIKRAITHLRNARREAPGDRYVQLVCAMHIDLLCWVLGDPSAFEKMVFECCEAIDRAERQ